MSLTDSQQTGMASNLKTGWILLIVGWIVYVLPFPMLGLGIIIAGALCFAAMVLAIISMSKGTGGVALLLATLIGTPVLYLLSWITWLYSM